MSGELHHFNNCTLAVEPFNQCCCNCVHLRAVHYHCSIKPRPPDSDPLSCVCRIQKGWACCPPEWGRVYDNWPQHSVGCEMYEAKPTTRSSS